MPETQNFKIILEEAVNEEMGEKEVLDRGFIHHSVRSYPPPQINLAKLEVRSVKASTRLSR
jgi:hypothetical protein